MCIRDSIEAIFIPGHTVGSVMFFDWKNHILFPGDDLDYSLWMHFKTSAPLYTYQKRLQQLEQYPKMCIRDRGQEEKPEGGHCSCRMLRSDSQGSSRGGCVN